MACILLLLVIIVAGQVTAAGNQLTKLTPVYTLNKYYDISGNIINLYSNPWSISISGDQTTVRVGNPIKLTAVVTFNGTLQKDVMVLFDAGSASSWSTTQFTDAGGKAYASFAPAGTGSYKVNATARQQSGSSFKVLDSTYVIVNVQNRPIAVEARASPESVNINDNADIRVSVKDFNTLSPVSGALVHLNASGGSLKTIDGATGADGIFTTTFMPAAAGTYTLGVTVTATGYDAWSGVVGVQGSSRTMNATVEFGPSPATAGSEATVTVIASDENGPVSGAVVNITAAGGNVTPVSVRTGPDGRYTAKIRFDQAGDYTVTATVNAEGYLQAGNSAHVTVQQGFNPLPAIIAGAICLVVLLVIAIILLNRWLKTDLKVVPKKDKIPADGAAKVHVRAQFVNGFGRPKKVSRDSDVDLETTAGSINSVTVPAGKDYADAELVAAREFGPVTITARSGGRVSLANVAFVVEKGTLDVTVQPAEIPADGKSSASVTIRIRDEKGIDVAPLEEKSVAVSTTLGNIPGPLTFPAKAQSASTAITAGDVSGVAVITAVLGDFRGEGRIAFKGLAKRFCMHCGTAMSLDAAQCPACGRTPPSGVDVKACPTCGTVIPEPARFCYHCGASQPGIKK